MQYNCWDDVRFQRTKSLKPLAWGSPIAGEMDEVDDMFEAGGTGGEDGALLKRTGANLTGDAKRLKQEHEGCNPQSNIMSICYAQSDNE